ncbi:MAG TPA: hypothetical protein PKK10_06295 [Woeseiaceae bacterium]|nr:hypothetical protein [Woeseiaceae bacterium]
MRTMTVPLLLLVSLLAVGCQDKGPAEKAGEKIDDVATDVGNAVEDACEDVKESANANDTDC